ncbi:hypothetical protein BGX31_009409 [Mortierella sp. GBA43]|nr:hypothetical protein BGX31_009409 [Mortierella sp. GBA43]
MADASSSSSSGHGNLSPRGALKLAKYHLENARKTTDPELVAMLYNESRATLSRMEQPTLETLLSSDCSQDPALREEITFILAELDEMLARLKQTDAATEALTQTGAEDLSDCAKSSQDGSVDTAVIPRQIFAENKRSPAMEFKLPDYGERITDIPQLAYCLRLLKSWSSSPDAILDPTARKWLCAFDKDKDNFDRIMALATDVITTFTRQGIKDIEFIKEAVRLAPVVEKPVYRYLLRQLCDLIEQSTVLDPHQLECLAQVIQGASMGYLENADLVRIIELLVNRLPEEHQEPLALSVSRAVDAIARTSIEDLDHEELLRSISVYLDGLKATSDPRLVYQAAYTYQALQHTPYDHSIWRAVLQRVEKPIELMDNARSIDAKEILQQLQDIHGELECESKEGAQDGSGMSLLDYLKDGLSFECRRSWYPALRMVKVLLWGGQFTEFKKFVIGVPCRRNPAFQWGLCQQLRDLAASLEWDTKTRLNTVAFLEDIYQR